MVRLTIAIFDEPSWVRERRKPWTRPGGRYRRGHRESDNPDHRAGDPIPGNNLEVYKLRIADPDRNTGKRGGYRLIYLWLRVENRLAGLFFYRKSQKEDVVKAEIADARKRLHQT